MANSLLQGILLTSCVLLVQSLVCHHCWGVSHPQHCTKIKTCNASELCFTEKIMSEDNTVFHNSGCTSKQVCNGENGVPCNGLRQCVSYCSTDRCNKNPCSSAGYKRSCKEYKKRGESSGIYTLDLGDGLPLIRVYCDMVTAGGGWTVFQRRKDGSENFYRDWNDYKHGFGDLRREFWLGNDNLHRLTRAGLTTLRVDLTDWASNSRYAQYSTFRVGPASNYYRLTVGNYSGNAGDSLLYHNGMAFSTKDSDHDNSVGRHCAQEFGGAWWYKSCYHSNLNGHYFANSRAPNGTGISWNGWKSATYSLKSTEMKLREP